MRVTGLTSNSVWDKLVQSPDLDSDHYVCKILPWESETQTTTVSSLLASLLQQPSTEDFCMQEAMLWEVSTRARELRFNLVRSLVL